MLDYPSMKISRPGLVYRQPRRRTVSDPASRSAQSSPPVQVHGSSLHWILRQDLPSLFLLINSWILVCNETCFKIRLV